MAKKIMGISKDSILSMATLYPAHASKAWAGHPVDRATLVFYRSLAIFRCFIIVILCSAGVCRASEFATTLIYAGGTFGPYPYNDPCSILGEPTSWIYDNDSYYKYNTFVACSMVYGAWNTGFNDPNKPGDPNNPSTPKKQLIVTLGPGSSIIVGFDHKVLDEPDNPYGMDLIVFGNAAFTIQGAVDPNSDMDTLCLSSVGSVIAEKVKVQVAAYPNPANPSDPNSWFGFSYGPSADGLFPTNRFAWDSANKRWGQPLNPLKPVNPNLKASNFAGLTVSQAIALYDGSAGGTGFDLEWLKPEDYQQLPIDPQTGKRWIQYVRLSYEGLTAGEVDAVADAAPTKVPCFPAGDINYDYRVDLQDLMILAQNWLVCVWNCEP